MPIRARAFLAALVAATTAALTLGAVTVPASAAPSPVTGGLPATASMDVLPTVQVNGVVWAQATVGNIVYAVGQFTSWRPAGSPAGTNESAASNIIAYDITTGQRVSTFNHTLNGVGKAVAVSPDGSTVYVGGAFTSVDGQARYRIAAFDTATGALVTSFKPAVNATVGAIAVSSTTVYAGGVFTAVGSVARSHLAAFTTSGALTTWAPVADKNSVAALTLSGDGTRLWAGGTFSAVNGTTTYGLAAIDPSSGALVTTPASNLNFGGGSGSGVLTLMTQGTAVYGGAYNYYGTGTLEGTFSLNGTTGAVNWINDCNGDTYSVYAIGDVMYDASHAHNCAPVGGFPQGTNAAGKTNSYHRALAFTTATSGYTNSAPDIYGWNWTAYQHSTILNWFPDPTIGTFTGQSQAAWSVTGNAQYVAMGGEFPKVNGVAQQGLVRFALHSVAPNAYGPSGIGAPLATTQPLDGGAQAAVISVTGAYDPDDGYLKYQLIRDGNTASPVDTVVAPTTGSWTTQPQVSLVDASGVGGSHSYTVIATGSGTPSVTSAAVTASLGSANTPQTFSPTSGGTSVSNGGANASAVVGAPSVAGSMLTVSFAATGDASLPGPANSCVTVTTPTGSVSTLKPVAVTTTGSSPTAYSGTERFLIPQAGSYAYSYSCSKWTQVALGTMPAAPNLASTATATASYTSAWEASPSALISGTDPTSSTPGKTGVGWGTWPNAGQQWVELDWANAVTASRASVYFYDDKGGLPLPQSWKVQYWSGTTWVDVSNPSSYGISDDTYNTVTFTGVSTTKLRFVIDGGTPPTGTLRGVGLLKVRVYQ